MDLTHSEKSVLLKALKSFPTEEIRVYVDEDGNEFDEEFTTNPISVSEEIARVNLIEKIQNMKSTAPKL